MEDHKINIDPEVLKQFVETTAKAAENIQTEIANVTPFIIEFNERLNSTFRPFFESLLKIQDEIQENIKKYPDSLITLAEYGWYLPLFSSSSISDIREFAYKLKNGDVDEVEVVMIQLIEDNIVIIENDLTNKFPNRAKPIKAAIRAHKKKEYDLSIPVFFAQTDGICKELTGYSFFGSNRSNAFKPYTYEWAEQLKAYSILGILTEPLKHKGGLNKHHSENNFIEITRHSVLHGESSDYGTIANSNKALSLLFYVGNIVYKAKQHIENN